MAVSVRNTASASGILDGRVVGALRAHVINSTACADAASGGEAWCLANVRRAGSCDCRAAGAYPTSACLDTCDCCSQVRNIATILPDGSPADAELPSLALRFTGDGDQYVVFDADGAEMLSPGAGSWSAAVWVRFDEAARGEVDLMYLLSLGQRLDSDNGMSVFYTNYHNTGWKVVFSGNDGALGAASAFSVHVSADLFDQRWHLVTMVLDRSNAAAPALRGYVDGLTATSRPSCVMAR